MFQDFIDTLAQRFPKHGWNSFPDLALYVGRVARESEMVRERLKPGCFPDSESSILLRMDVPIPIFRHMGGNGPSDLVPVVPFVFVYIFRRVVAGETFG